MDKDRQRRLGIVLSYVVLGSSFAVGLVYTPYIIKCLGSSEYGNYNYVSSITSYLTLLTCGFGSAYLRFASPYRKTNDKEGIENINGLFLALFAIMGTIALIVGGLMTWKSDWILAGKITAEELATGKVLMGVLVINVFMTFPVSIFNSYIIAQEEFVFQKGLAIFRTFLAPAVSIIILHLGYKAVGLAVSALIVSIVIDLFSILFCLIKLRMRFRFSFDFFKKAKDVFVFSSFLLLSMIVDQVNWSVDRYILGKLCGTAVVAVYTVGATINTYYKSMGESISNVFVPRVYDILSKENGDYEVSKLMARLGRIQFMVLSLIITGFVFFGKSFISLWVGNEYSDAYYVILLLMIPVTIPEIQKIGLEIQKAKNLHKFRSVVYTIIAIVNIILTIPLAKAFGAVGAAMGTAITVVVGNGLIMNIYYKKKVNIDINLFWREVLKITPCVIIASLLGYFIMKLCNPTSWLLFGASVILYTLCYTGIVALFGFNEEERSYIKRVFCKNIK